MNSPRLIRALRCSSDWQEDHDEAMLGRSGTSEERNERMNNGTCATTDEEKPTAPAVAPAVRDSGWGRLFFQLALPPNFTVCLQLVTSRRDHLRAMVL